MVEKFKCPGPDECEMDCHFVYVTLVDYLELEKELKRYAEVIEQAIAYVDADSSDGGETIAAWQAVLHGEKP
jgi:hypothetical protein